MTTPTPPDMPGPGRPVDVVPMPAVVNLTPMPGAVDGQPQTILRLEIITPAGSAFAHLSVQQLEQMMLNWQAPIREARTGLATPPPGLIIPGANGRHPG